ncbi:MAG: sodium:proton antiporter [Holosporaceae bacterium]|jgi:Na+/H+ antiporter NhaD/arsenite permease-like protein|nr:sodium:proton antiporter [Holosporaceae bacterium]
MEFLSLWWSIPFLGIIFSIAFVPLWFPEFWERGASYVTGFWSAVYLSNVAYFFGFSKVFEAIFNPMIGDYIPFIILISSLYIISGGIYVNFPRGRGPLFNTLYLFFGSFIAGWIGTTGASALLIRPYLRANSGRKHSTHLIIFFIFLVANIGGAATPLGDPPLFIGFLKGVDFFWFLKNLYIQLFCTIGILCLLFFIMDSVLYRTDHAISLPSDDAPFFQMEGKINILLILLVLATVILCHFDGEFFLWRERVAYSSLVRNLLLLTLSAISLRNTPAHIKWKNGFSMAPIREIAELFLGIFITVVPIICILHQGKEGSLGALFQWIAPTGEFLAARCFWISGLLSSFLDNAPTFLIFFHLTSGDPQALMTTKAHILTAFSISTVFMGALTYIGNAPNLIVKSVAITYGQRVPSFLGYMAWSIPILIPVFVIIARFL